MVLFHKKALHFCKALISGATETRTQNAAVQGQCDSQFHHSPIKKKRVDN